VDAGPEGRARRPALLSTVSGGVAVLLAQGLKYGFSSPSVPSPEGSQLSVRFRSAAVASLLVLAGCRTSPNTSADTRAEPNNSFDTSAASGAASTRGPSTVSDARTRAQERCDTGDQVSGHKLLIVTTVAPITSILANIVGDRAEVRGVTPEGTNSHTFEPSPSVAELFTKADVVFANGLSLEDPTRELADSNLNSSATMCELGTATLPVTQYIYDFSFPEEGGKPNPHLWTDPPKVKAYAELATKVLARKDRANAATYEANYASFSARVGALDSAFRSASATVPEAHRQLLTYHDAYAYFAKDHGWKIIGAIQPSSFDEPTPKDVAKLIGQIKAVGVPAIFGSEVFPSPVLAQIGKEAGVTYVDVLRDDDLPGRPGDREHSWLGLMRFDYVTIVEALGGDATALRNLDTGDVVPDMAMYPQ
jgi:ABC-type Zn uptake system ZnuABC Zn-binding protein ZnuA